MDGYFIQTEMEKIYVMHMTSADTLKVWYI